MTKELNVDDKQISGDHYKNSAQHWNMLPALGYGYEYYAGQATKYLSRWRKKNGVRDILKGQHFIEKLLSLAEENPKFLPYGHVDDADIREIAGDHLKSHLNYYFEVNELDNVSKSICMSVIFANRTSVLRDAVQACTELAEFERRSGDDKPDLEMPVALQFHFIGYVDGGVAMKWKCKRCGEEMQLAMSDPPSLVHACALHSK